MVLHTEALADPLEVVACGDTVATAASVAEGPAAPAGDMSKSFSGLESLEGLSCEMGLYGGMVFTFPPFFWNMKISYKANASCTCTPSQYKSIQNTGQHTRQAYHSTQLYPPTTANTHSDSTLKQILWGSQPDFLSGKHIS